jgi:predicted extracellular nuclease
MLFVSRRRTGARLHRSAWAALLCAVLASGCGQEGRTASSGSSSQSDPSSTSSGSGGSGGASPDPVALRIANWNVHNFVNDLNDSDVIDEEYQGPDAYDAQRAVIGDVVEALAADVVVFAELENQAVLDDLVDNELGGAYAGRAISVGNDPRGINVAAISRNEFVSVVSHAEDSFTPEGMAGPQIFYARDCLELHLDVNGRRVILLGVHYKAKTEDPADDDEEKRLAEAHYTREIADALAAEHPGAAIVILGDYNDVPGSPPYLETVGDPPDVYSDAADEVAAGDRWTFDFNGTLELVDHQMTNPAMTEMRQAADILHGADVETASDHAPVAATYLVTAP